MQYLNPDFNVDSFAFTFTCNGFVIPKHSKQLLNCFTFSEYQKRQDGSILIPAQNVKYSADFHPSELEFEIPYLEITNICVNGKFYDTEALFLRDCLITQNCQPISQPYVDAYDILKKDMDKVRSIFEHMVDTMIQIYFDPEDKETIAKIEASVERINRNSIRGAFGNASKDLPHYEHISDAPEDDGPIHRSHRSLHDAPLCDDFEDLERDYD